MSKTDVLILTSREGHASVAEAIETALLKEKVKTQQFYHDNFAFGTYRLIYVYQPQLFKHFYELAKKEFVAKFADELSSVTLYPVIKKPLDEAKPKIIISTNASFNAAIHKYCRWHHLKVINIITNPRQLVPIEIYAPAEINTAFDEFQKNHVLEIYPQSNVLQTGWFVRERFEQAYQKNQVRKKLKLKVKPLTFLFVSGYEGTEGIVSHLKKLIDNIKNTQQDLQLVIACGKNDFLLTRMQWFANRVNKKYQHIKIIALPFTSQIHAYMQAADLVIGKAGPNTLFESVATLTPFFATTHIRGLEEGSLDIIKEYKLGFVEERPTQMIRLLTKIVKNPTILEKFTPHLKKLAQINKQAKTMLVEQIKAIL